MTIERVQSGSPWEESIGFARAVGVGDRVLVGGTTPFRDGMLYGEGDPYQQTKVATENALAALAQFDLGIDSVIRTRLLLTHNRDIDEVSRAHKELFDKVRPVCTLVVVSGFVDSRILVEIEVEAYRGSQGA